MNKNPILFLVEQYRKGKLQQYDFIDQMHSFNKTLYYLSQHLKNTDIKKIEITDDHLIFTTRDHNLQMTFNGIDRRGVPYDILNFGKYEQMEEEVIYGLIQEGFTIFDVGANIGWYALNFGKRFPSTTVYAFEPIPDSYRYLLTNIGYNNLKNIKPFNYGLSDTTGETSFCYFPAGSVLASVKNLINYEHIQTLSCSVKTLDEVVKKEKVQKLDFLKCDVEGAELSVLKGGTDTLTHHLPIVYIELLEQWTVQFGYHPNDVVAFLKQLGYRCFAPCEGKLYEFHKIEEKPKKERFTNFVFLHSTKHAKQIQKFGGDHLKPS